jgi:NAD(P)-dependent dehydrogenase (short-subunit alcohol dehydrogenase family)
MAGVLEGKRALVTGAHRGIGRAIAEAFVAAGANTVIADIEGADKAAKEIGHDTIGVTCDVRSGDSVAAAVTEATQALGGLDVLVNNAGVENFAPLHEMTEQEFDRLFSVNLRGTWLVYKHAVPALADGGGAIVNIASLAGVVGFPLLGAYSATKAGVVRMTEVMALELRDHGVRANAICPGFIDTAMVERAFRDFEAATGMPLGELITAGQGRLGKPEEVASLATYLASDGSSFVNGTAITIDGGMNLRRV